MPKKHGDHPRNFDVRMGVITPSGDDGTRTSFKDRALDGLKVCWSAGDQLALYGPMGVVKNGQQTFKDRTLGDGPLQLYCLSADGMSNVCFGEFGYETELQWADGDEADFAVLYPGDRFGYDPKNPDTQTLTFTDQNGTLATLGNFQYAWGYAHGKVTPVDDNAEKNAKLVLSDNMPKPSCNANDRGYTYNDNDGLVPFDHPHGEDEYVVLDNKEAIVRISLVNADATKTLTDELDGGIITSIKITDVHVKDNGKHNDLTKSYLNVQTGVVTTLETDDPKYYVITLTGDPIKTVNITKSVADYDLSANGRSWGSAFYLAVPTDLKGITSSFEMVITTKKNGVPTTYYAFLEENHTLREALYYLTAPVRCCLTVEEAKQARARVYLYYKASIVYDIDEF